MDANDYKCLLVLGTALIGIYWVIKLCKEYVMYEDFQKLKKQVDCLEEKMELALYDLRRDKIDEALCKNIEYRRIWNHTRSCARCDAVIKDDLMRTFHHKYGIYFVCSEVCLNKLNQLAKDFDR
jgi:hypothetical protein